MKPKTLFGIPADHFTPLEVILVAFFLAMTLLCAFFEFVYEVEIYRAMHGWFWLYTGIFYALGFSYPLAKMGTTREALKKQVFAYAIFITSTLVLGLVFIDRFDVNQRGTGLYTSLAATISALVVGLGWLVTASSSARSHRRQHTMKILLDSRFSMAYQQYARDLRRYYPHGTKIPRETIERFLNDPLSFKTDEERLQFSTVEACIYLLNFYEFIAVAIRHGDLEEDMLFDTLSGIACSLVDRAEHVISASRQRGGNLVYAEVESLCSRWRDKANSLIKNQGQAR